MRSSLIFLASLTAVGLAIGCTANLRQHVQYGVLPSWIEFQAAGSPESTSPPSGEGDWVVAPEGDDRDMGSADAPFASLQRAVDAAEPGDLIRVRGGMYRLHEPLRIRESGTAEAPIQLRAWPDEHPVIDGSGLSGQVALVSLSASYWTLSGFEIRNGPYAGVLLEHAHHNRLERLDVHHNGWSGVHLDKETSNNLIVDTRSHHNFDEGTGGEHADGFAAKHRTSRRNTFLRCEAFHNSDDGFDLLESDPQWIDQSVAYRNGLTSDGDRYPGGDGNGFKLGIARTDRWRGGGGHVVTRSIAWGNRYTGFTSNGATTPIIMLSNTAFENGRYDFFFADAAHVLRNNLAAGAANEIGPQADAARNSWQLGIDDPGFRSTDPSSADFLRLTEDSPAIGAGAEVPFEHEGENPDLGAYEYVWRSHDP